MGGGQEEGGDSGLLQVCLVPSWGRSACGSGLPRAGRARKSGLGPPLGPSVRADCKLIRAAFGNTSL